MAHVVFLLPQVKALKPGRRARSPGDTIVRGRITNEKTTSLSVSTAGHNRWRRSVEKRCCMPVPHWTDLYVDTSKVPVGRFGILQVGGYDSTVFRKPVSEFVPPVMITPNESVDLQSLTLYIFYLACTILSGQAPDRASPSYGVSGLPFEFFLDFQVHWLQNRGSNLPIHQPHILLRKKHKL